jgi:nucleoid-associated protein YgaU
VQKARNKGFVIAGALVVCTLALVAESAFAQSLGEIARRERARQKHLANPATHVYTNDDLGRQHILVPSDRARFDADRPNAAPATTPQAAKAPASLAKPTEIPLGDVARYYRLLKYLREEQRQNAEEALPGGTVLAAPDLPRMKVAPLPRQKRSLPSPAPLPAVVRDFPPAEGVRVRRGDSLWKLAERYLGDGSQWREIFAVNPQLPNPNLIRVGEFIALPQQAQGSSQLAGQEQRVQQGDSLWKLAKTHFGNGFAWTCIAQANPQIQNANLIYPGQLIAIPAGCTAAPQAAPTAARVFR